MGKYEINLGSGITADATKAYKDGNLKVAKVEEDGKPGISFDFNSPIMFWVQKFDTAEERDEHYDIIIGVSTASVYIV